MQILKCIKCKKYTFKQKCAQCGEKTVQPRPPRFSLIDKYAEYRRKVKKKELEKRGLL